MTIKTPITIAGCGPIWALMDADGNAIAEVYGYEAAEALQEAVNLVFRPKLKPKADVIVRKIAIVETE
ncbi:hypothetical protein JET14_13480 [Martelella lutilitoris]|uniref:Uncharacterized protein n=1 Tax=Martelella lutilitoris TaxID=2583532 RepID=A0A7T7HHN6_9HYPH|nr:hypothetical protein [Martelella lutilitoris]QQM29335.1 hypothetical protein JET14_13480 [Martelella lutilitoris]